MPQTAKSTNKKARSRNGSSPRSSSSTRNGSAKRSTSQPAGSSRKRAKPARSSTRARSKATKARPKSRSSAQASNGAASFASAAVERTKSVGGAISEAASKGKTPLIAGGTALVGAAAGAVVKDRLEKSRSKGPLRRLRGIGVPKPGLSLNLANLDLEKVKSAADRVSAYGQQASDIAGAAEKTRKKNN
jgi:hypothetical protein